MIGSLVVLAAASITGGSRRRLSTGSLLEVGELDKHEAGAGLATNLAMAGKTIDITVTVTVPDAPSGVRAVGKALMKKAVEMDAAPGVAAVGLSGVGGTSPIGTKTIGAENGAVATKTAAVGLDSVGGSSPVGTKTINGGTSASADTGHQEWAAAIHSAGDTLDLSEHESIDMCTIQHSDGEDDCNGSGCEYQQPGSHVYCHQCVYTAATATRGDHCAAPAMAEECSIAAPHPPDAATVQQTCLAFQLPRDAATVHDATLHAAVKELTNIALHEQDAEHHDNVITGFQVILDNFEDRDGGSIFREAQDAGRKLEKKRWAAQ